MKARKRPVAIKKDMDESGQELRSDQWNAKFSERTGKLEKSYRNFDTQGGSGGGGGGPAGLGGSAGFRIGAGGTTAWSIS
jgi:hypothetical protein